MSENNGSNGTVVNVESNGIFASYEEASQNKPESAKATGWKVFKVTRPDGTEVFGWGFNGGVVIDKVARADGYDVCSAESRRSPQLTPQTIANKLESMGVNLTVEQLRTLGLNALADAKEAAEKEESSKPSKPNTSKKGNK